MLRILLAGYKQGQTHCASLSPPFVSSGPYLIFRAPPVDAKSRKDMAWFAANVLENKIFNWVLVVLCLTIPFTTGAVTSLEADGWSTTIQGFWDVASTTKIVSVSSVDLAVLTVAAASLIPQDYRLRVQGQPQQDAAEKANWIAMATVLVPVLGAALYCALRPPLPEE